MSTEEKTPGLMGFGQALETARSGRRVTRPGLSAPLEFRPDRVSEPGNVVNPHFAVGGNPYVPSQDDLMAYDWQVAEGEGT
jgi:hypothetical protein